MLKSGTFSCTATPPESPVRSALFTVLYVQLIYCSVLPSLSTCIYSKNMPDLPRLTILQYWLGVDYVSSVSRARCLPPCAVHESFRHPEEVVTCSKSLADQAADQAFGLQTPLSPFHCSCHSLFAVPLSPLALSFIAFYLHVLPILFEITFLWLLSTHPSFLRISLFSIFPNSLPFFSLYT